MIYESKISFTKADKNGNDKCVKERYLISNAVTFGDAENQTMTYCQGENDLDVIDVKRSKIKEIINTRDNQEEKIFLADVADIQTNDEGEEVEILYKVALFARSFDEAYIKMNKFLEQGYSMQIIGVKKTNFIDVITL